MKVNLESFLTGVLGALVFYLLINFVHECVLTILSVT